MVSAAQREGKIEPTIRIDSEHGRTMTYCMPEGWSGMTVVATKDGEKVPSTVVNATLRSFAVETEAGERYELREEKQV